MGVVIKICTKYEISQAPKLNINTINATEIWREDIHTRTVCYYIMPYLLQCTGCENVLPCCFYVLSRLCVVAFCMTAVYKNTTPAAFVLLVTRRGWVVKS